jgi:hypothetical protein
MNKDGQECRSKRTHSNIRLKTNIRKIFTTFLRTETCIFQPIHEPGHEPPYMVVRGYSRDWFGVWGVWGISPHFQKKKKKSWFVNQRKVPFLPAF